MKLRSVYVAAGTLAILLAWSAPAADYKGSIQDWRRQREASLKADGGWLTVAGLFWLKPGANTFGAGAGNDIVLPPGSAPVRAGVIEFANGQAVLRAGKDAKATLRGKPVSTLAMRSDKSGAPDVVALGSRLTMYIIQRGDRFGLRLKDRDSEARREFKGLQWYPVDSAYRVRAKFVPYNPPKRIPVPNVLGQTENMESPGYLEFTLGGRQLRLDPVSEGPGELFIIFRDLTSGKETYPAGRFLYAPPPKDGVVDLDFNRAENPPCAFTPFATCPLPPKQNRLPVSVRAGEKKYHE